MGYRIAIYPSETQRAAIHAMRTTLGHAQTRRHDRIDRYGATRLSKNATASSPWMTGKRSNGNLCAVQTDEGLANSDDAHNDVVAGKFKPN